MSTLSQYDYELGSDGPLAILFERLSTPEFPIMISPPIGWIDLVLQLNADLAAILPNYTIAQVKEKFAGLRYYIDSFGVAKDDPRIDLARELIEMAEKESERTCQVCGQPGTLQDEKFWRATLCEDHR